MSLHRSLHWVLLANLLLYALMAGFFYAYSVSVMDGLNGISHDEATTAMHSINSAVRNPIFFMTYFLSPLITFILCVLLIFKRYTKICWFMLMAGLSYMFGVMLPTALVNVPLNNALAINSQAIDFIVVDNFWNSYAQQWVIWNHVRAFMCSASLLFTAYAFAAFYSMKYTWKITAVPLTFI